MSMAPLPPLTGNRGSIINHVLYQDKINYLVLFFCMYKI